ncbi:MAG TPA: hypothetical protein VF703_19630 [Pyrinomonadaceae bacterium]|jgi:hypothetical protein
MKTAKDAKGETTFASFAAVNYRRLRGGRALTVAAHASGDGQAN